MGFTHMKYPSHQERQQNGPRDRNQSQRSSACKKIAALGTFTAGIAHELNNPINNISLTAETFVENHFESMDDDAKELMNDILDQA